MRVRLGEGLETGVEMVVADERVDLLRSSEEPRGMAKESTGVAIAEADATGGKELQIRALGSLPELEEVRPA